MSDPKIGAIEWRDLTVEHAKGVADFYQSVVGWKAEPVSMGDYDDYNMNLADGGQTIAGVCHARGGNSGLPPQWMMYVRVANVAESVTAVKSQGGKVIAGPTSFSGDTYYVISDPAGAVLTIFSESV